MSPHSPTNDASEGEADLSAESAIASEIRALDTWLAAHRVSAERSKSGQRSRDGFYWRSGYRAGLQRALAMLSSRGWTVH